MADVIVMEPRMGALPKASEAVVPAAVAVSVIVVTWNSARWIERCLRSIRPALSGLRCQILVHDNASRDETLAILESLRAVDKESLTVVRSDTNDGFAAATNRAIARSTGRYVLLLNPDCELAPDALAQLVDFLDRNHAVSIAAPALVDERGDSQREFQLRRLPTLTMLASEILLLDRLLPSNRRRKWYRYHDLDLAHPQRIEQPAGAALLVRREVFDEIGLLDEQFAPAWFEDVDFFRRMADAGKTAWVVPSAQARHYGGSSLDQMAFAEFVTIWYRNMWRYAQKWMPARQRETLRWIVIAGMTARCIVMCFGLRPHGVKWTDAWRGYTSVLKQAFRRWTA